MVGRNHDEINPADGRNRRSLLRLVLALFFSATGLVLIYEHRMHLFASGGLLILVIGLCILMHLFMHGGQGGHADTDSKSTRKDGS